MDFVGLSGRCAEVPVAIRGRICDAVFLTFHLLSLLVASPF